MDAETQKYIKEKSAVERQMNQLKLEKTSIGLEIAEKQNKLRSIRNQFRTNWMPRDEYVALIGEQESVTAELDVARRKAFDIKRESSKWHDIGEKLRATEIGHKVSVMYSTGKLSSDGESVPSPEPLLALRDKWAEFAKDSTRISSMRLMASTFAKDLTELIDGRTGDCVT